MRIFNELLIATLLFSACSKSSSNTNNTSNVTAGTSISANSAALPNTVDQTDTLRVMAYNVLNFGDGCQGNTNILDGYLKTIIQYTQPDILSCEKIYSFPVAPGNILNLADDITNNALNAALGGRYTYATPTNASAAGDMSVLFYNKQKLGYIKTQTILNNITDFDLYKLYYKDVNLAITKDTTFMYVVVNHTQSGSSSAQRDQQVTLEMQVLRNKYAYFPNLINMGDFNTHNSSEAGYQAIISAVDTATRMSDPPFGIDASIKYPADWDTNPQLFQQYLTTSTRLSATVPNTCGTSGGAKSWYDHIFLSSWLVNGSNYIRYAPKSYQTIGNDGNRLGVDINGTLPIVNNSVPPAVLQALFRFSNKYPVMIKLVVRANRNAYSPTDPTERN